VAVNGDSQSADSSVLTGERFIDAFYSWRSENLQVLMAANADATGVLYYQGWARAANYAVVVRRPCQNIEDEVVCAITVTDDFGTALGYRATDTFRLGVADQRITKIAFAGDDSPIFNAMLEWLQQQRPEILTGPCDKMFAGGLTPGQCARAVAQGARDYMQTSSAREK
jgi:hypothetical protein